MTSPARAIPLRLTAPETAPRQLPSAKGLLRLVPQRRSQARRTPFVVVLVTLLAGGLLGLLLLNTLVAQGSFTLHDLATQSRALQLQEQVLAGQVEADQAPAALARRAEALGMVPGGAPAFLRLPDGRVLGVPSVGEALPSPAPSATAGTATAGPATAATGPARPTAAGSSPAHHPAAPRGSTTWTAPRQTPPPTSTGGHR